MSDLRGFGRGTSLLVLLWALSGCGSERIAPGGLSGSYDAVVVPLAAPDPGTTNPMEAALAPDGTIYDVDGRDYRLYRYAADGTPLGPVGRRGPEASATGRLERVAVAPGSGEVYVLDADKRRIAVFSADGRFRRSWPTYEAGRLIFPQSITISAAGAVILLAPDGLYVFTPEGELTRRIEPDIPAYAYRSWVRTDGAGRFFLHYSYPDEILVLDPAGGELARWSAANLIPGYVTPAGHVIGCDKVTGAIVERSLDGAPLATRPGYRAACVIGRTSAGALVLSGAGGLVRVGASDPDLFLVRGTPESDLDEHLFFARRAWPLADGRTLAWSPADMVQPVAGGLPAPAWLVGRAPGAPEWDRPVAYDVACDGVDRVYAICSPWTIRKYSVAGEYLGDVGAAGVDAGHYSQPGALAIGPGRNLYVADPVRNEVVIFDTEGRWIRSVPVNLGLFVDFAVSPVGHLYLSQPEPDRVVHLDAAGSFLGNIVLPKSLPANASLTSQETAGPFSVGGMACDGAGRLYVTDQPGDRVFVFSPDDEPLGLIGRTGSQPGEFWKPSSIMVGADGRIAICDDANRRIQVLTPRTTP